MTLQPFRRYVRSPERWEAAHSGIPQLQAPSGITCVSVFLAEYQKGTISFQQYNQSVKDCCVGTGGVWQGLGSNAQYVAPPGEGANTQPGSSCQRPPDATTTLTLTPGPDNPSVPPRPGAVG